MLGPGQPLPATCSELSSTLCANTGGSLNQKQEVTQGRNWESQGREAKRMLGKGPH
jgi:hypothetical protein